MRRPHIKWGFVVRIGVSLAGGFFFYMTRRISCIIFPRLIRFEHHFHRITSIFVIDAAWTNCHLC